MVYGLKKIRYYCSVRFCRTASHAKDVFFWNITKVDKTVENCLHNKRCLQNNKKRLQYTSAMQRRRLLAAMSLCVSDWFLKQGKYFSSVQSRVPNIQIWSFVLTGSCAI